MAKVLVLLAIASGCTPGSAEDTTKPTGVTDPGTAPDPEPVETGLSAVTTLDAPVCAESLGARRAALRSHRDRRLADRPDSGGAWGVSLADFDNDGWIDLLLPTVIGLRMYQGTEQGFVDVSAERLRPTSSPIRAGRSPRPPIGTATGISICTSAGPSAR